MLLKKSAIAGTLESSDVQIIIEPGHNGIELSLSSSVMNLYGKQIRAAILTTLAKLGVENALGGLGCNEEQITAHHDVS
ncbi:MAG: citD [Anaerospora sp.]|nr:citD [Anaerospora sp.]